MSAGTRVSEGSASGYREEHYSAKPMTAGAFSAAPAGSTRTLIVALELGVLGDYLMRTDVIGLNLTLWCWALLFASVMVRNDSTTVLDRRRWLLLGATAFFASVPTWRTTGPLVFMSGIAVLTLLVLSAWTAGAPGIVLAQRSVGAYLLAAWTGFVHIVAGAIPLLTAEARARSEIHTTYRRPLGAALRGLALSLPVVFVLGSLLMAADAGYERLVEGLFRWDAGVVASHVFLTGFFTWLGAAYLCASLRWARPSASDPVGVRLGVIEGGMVLGVVNLLFLSFMAVQLRHLFGGTEHVLTTAGLTLAEYARSGFFELVTVTTLTLPLMVGISGAVQPESVSAKRAHRVLMSALVILLLALVASALGRMRLYQAEYGLTLSRVHATAFMMWICGCIIWFAATVLRGRPARFAFGSIVGGLVILGLLIVANPAALVVRANAVRAAEGRDFDASDAAALGDDALPELLAVLPAVSGSLDLRERCDVSRAIDEAGIVGGDGRPVDWRGWNLARTRARSAAKRNGDMAAKIVGTQPCPAVADSVGPAPVQRQP
jgi:hypothetical protein